MKRYGEQRGVSLSRSALALGLARELLAVRCTEESLAQADRLRGDLDQFVVLDILQGGFQSQLPWRLQLDVLVAGLGPHVRELLFLGRIHVHVARARVLTDDHS